MDEPMKKLYKLLTFLALLLFAPPLFAQAPTFTETSCNLAVGPVVNNTCYDTTNGQWYVYNGTRWIPWSPSMAGTGGAATAITVDSTTLDGVGTDVQAVLEEVDDSLATKIPIASINIDSGVPGLKLSAGAPAAGSCAESGQFSVDTTNDVPYFCSDGAAGNPRSFATLGSAYNQVSDGTNSASAVGSETLRFEAGTGIAITVTAGSPDKVNIAATGGSGSIFLPLDLKAAIPSDGTGTLNNPAQYSTLVSTGTQTANTPKLTMGQWLFDPGAAEETIHWQFINPCSASPVLKVAIKNPTVQSGTNTFILKFGYGKVGDAADVAAKVYATPQTATVTLANNQAAGIVKLASAAITATDSVAQYDLVSFFLGRDDSDTAGGDMALMAAGISCTP
jgi:hypothetical protein